MFEMLTVFKLHSSLHNLGIRMASTNIQQLSIFNEKALIDGQWIDAKSGKKFDVYNPSTGAKIASVPDMGVENTKAAIASSKTAFSTWSKTSVKERSQLLRKLFNRIIECGDEFSTLITAENGKTLTDARAEMQYSANYIEWFSEDVRRIAGEVVSPPLINNKRLFTIRQPVGVCGVITPWNFPLAMLSRKMGALLAAGCTAVVKPSEDTPLSALALAHLALEVGFPPGVFNVVTSSRENVSDVGHEICSNPDISKITFTGSTAVGKILLRESASTVKKATLELGGNAPIIVFESADIELAVKCTVAAKFRCSGQTCVSPNRMFVHSSIYDAVVKGVVEETNKLVMGDGNEPGVNIGPLINTKAVDKVDDIVQRSIKAGAVLATGGKRKGNTFYFPTILTETSQGMPCTVEEIFGPVISISKFSSEEEIINVANDVRVGLASYFFTRDSAQMWRVAEALQSGMVGVNESLLSTVEIPFGGWKESGYGVEGSVHAIDEYLQMKSITMNMQSL